MMSKPKIAIIGAGWAGLSAAAHLAEHADVALYEAGRVAGGTMIIELGFLLTYHAGGAVQWSGVAVAGMAALMLAPAGVLLFGEPFSWHKALGVMLTLSGLALIAHR